MYRQNLILWGICLFLSAPASGEHIRVVTEYLKPYQIKQTDGELGGYMTEIVHALFLETGDTPEIEVMPWARAYNTALTEKNVLIYSIVETEERRKHFHWIGKIPTAPIFFWGLENKFTNLPSAVADLSELRIAVLRHSNVHKYLQEKAFHHLVPIADESRLLPMLLLKRVDLIVGNEKSMAMRLQRNRSSIDDLARVLEIDELNTYLSVAFNTSSDIGIVNRFKAAYSKLNASGELAEIRKKWRGEEYAKQAEILQQE